MRGFDLTPEQERLVDEARRFAEERVVPAAAGLEPQGAFCGEVLREMGERGYLGLPVPAEHGGGGDLVSFLLAVEEVARGWAAPGLAAGVSAMVALALGQHGTPAQKERYLPRMAKGEILGCFALTEPGAGSDAAALSATATLCSAPGGDGYVIEGRKLFSTNAGEAGVYLVFAKTDPAAPGIKGISAFLVDAGTLGLEFGLPSDKWGMRGSVDREVFLNGCRVPASNRLGEEGQGFRIALSALDTGRLAVAAQAVGVAQASLDAAVAFVKERQQFGAPLARLQAVQFAAADIACGVDAARLLLHRAARMAARGERCSAEISMAKLFATEQAMTAASKAVQLHGGRGVTNAYPVGRYFRDAKVMEIYEGTSEIQRLVIAREVLG
ncbi:MAG: acyl-CoA dehydrogenase family protein [Firmicutes bacterium]|nr:acyl-CoA dehydrogenase family protein [Bacillota bacterium]